MKRLCQSLAKPDSAQASIRQSILRFYSQRGIEQTREFCQKLLEAENHKDNKDFKAKVHGEICEALLEAILTDYIKKNKLSNRWFFEKGMVIKDLDSRNKDFYTELDLTLFTPGKVVLFECKSYAGEKKLCDECTIVRSCGEFDVYKQNKNHMVVLNTNIKSCCTSNVAGAYKLALFNFSIGGLKDLRDEKRKKIMPVIDINNIEAFLDSLTKQRPVWDILKLKKICNVIMDKNASLRKKHLKYVKTLHH